MRGQNDDTSAHEPRSPTPEDRKWRARSDFVAGALMAIAAGVAGAASRPSSTDWHDFAAPTSQWATKETTLCQWAWFVSVFGVLVFPAAVHFFRGTLYYIHRRDPKPDENSHTAWGETSGHRSKLKWAEYGISATMGTMAVYWLSRRRALTDPGETAPEPLWVTFEIMLLWLSGLGLQSIGWFLDAHMNVDDHPIPGVTDDKKPQRAGLFFVGMGIFSCQLLNSVAPYDKALRLVYLMGYVPFAILMCVSMILHDKISMFLHDKMTAPHQTPNKDIYAEMVNYLEVGYNICSCAAKIPLALIICFGKGDTDTDNLWVVGVVCLQIAMLLGATRCVYLGWHAPNADRQGSVRKAVASFKKKLKNKNWFGCRAFNNNLDFNL